MSVDLIVRQLRAARLAASRSQQSVAGEIGINQSNVSDWENGVTNPTLSSLQSWARALGHAVVLLPMSGPVSTSPETGPRDPREDDEPPYHFGEMEYVQPLRPCTCPAPEHGTRENRGHLLGCPTLRAESTKDEERTEGGAA